MKKQTLRQAIEIAHSGNSKPLARAICCLDGLPEGGWGETAQAELALVEDLPGRNERTYKAGQFIAAAYSVSPRTGRYVMRSLEEALAEAAKLERRR